jgi:hypothetical protein
LTRVLPVLIPLLWLVVTVIVVGACRTAARSDAAQHGSPPRRAPHSGARAGRGAASSPRARARSRI